TQETEGSSSPSRGQGPREIPPEGDASSCSRTRRVRGVPPHVPVHVALRSGTGLAGIESAGGLALAQPESSSAQPTTSRWRRALERGLRERTRATPRA